VFKYHLAIPLLLSKLLKNQRKNDYDFAIAFKVFVHIIRKYKNCGFLVVHIALENETIKFLQIFQVVFFKENEKHFLT